MYNWDKNVNNSVKLAKLKQRNLSKATIVENLKELLQCDDTKSSELYYNYVNDINKLKTAKRNIEYLFKNEITTETIKENGFLLPMSLGKI